MSDKRHEDMAPGDEAPPGEAAAGEDICPQCRGRVDGQRCNVFAGTGRIQRAVGGG